MNTFSGLLQTPLAGAVGFTLFHFLWQGLLTALVLAAMLRICRSPDARYAAACIAMFAMPLAFGVTLAISLPGHMMRGAVPGVSLDVPVLAPARFTAVFAPSFLEWIAPVARCFVPIWMAGVIVLCLWNAGGWIAARRLRRSASSPNEPSWPNRVRELAARLGISAPVLLLESALVDVPMAAGWLRPAILIPAGLVISLPAEQIEYLLIHELAHIRRFDYAINLLQKIVEALLFYHPAVWWVSGVMRAERENCCDDVVLALHSGAAARYAHALAALEQNRWQMANAASGGSLSRRIHRILNRPVSLNGSAGPAIALGLLAITGALAWPAIHTSGPGAVRLLPQAAAGTKESNPFDKWLNEDVVWIISPEERSAFGSLKTDAEREQFVEQFWERRDPTPGTPQNEFREEHYRRLTYANARFSSAKPGWQTDRGRIYIRFGPPDEIDAHPSGDGGNPPYQTWSYRLIEGVGSNVIVRFTDVNRDGNYVQDSDPHGVPGSRRVDPAK